MTIPLTAATDLISTIRPIRKGLRDMRDRAHRADPPSGWAAVAMAGTVSGDHLMLLVQHAGIDRQALWAMLERRWPMVMVSVVETIEPRCDLSVEQTMQLARQHRGIEPIRVIVPAQVRVGDQSDGWGEPMPVVV